MFESIINLQLISISYRQFTLILYLDLTKVVFIMLVKSYFFVFIVYCFCARLHKAWSFYKYINSFEVSVTFLIN